ncbi:hypothetical protein [Methylorubrum extorquens]|uniref:hypothetical protein n=1 Tax=Methylorubrum extorquens TaxID=408 RepID=UPI001EE5F1FB|nr:hypothetical protein [Methylorubrum extorquens]MCG5249609.1 hypothetical protein [Methylorubrum extorquens]
MTTQPDEITYGNDTWHRSSGQLPYAYALRWAWLCMIEELYGEDAHFDQFFGNVPKGMFVEEKTCVPFRSGGCVSGYLNEAGGLFFTASLQPQYIEMNGKRGQYAAQAVITVTVDPYPDHITNCFSAVIFNSTCTFNEGFLVTSMPLVSALSQSGFDLDNVRAEHIFRSAVVPMKLAGHPLLKHYKI